MASELLYGRQAVMEALRAGHRKPHALAVSRTVRPDAEWNAMLERAARRGLRPTQVDPRRLDEMCGGGHHQGVALEAGPYAYEDFARVRQRVETRGTAALVLFLDHIQDPQNLGAILRTADAAAVDAVVLPNARAVGVTPAVVRASSGAAEHVRVCMVANLPTAMRTLKEAGLWIAGLDGNPGARPYTEVDLSGGVGLVVGNEGEGMGRLVRETCDFLIRIPMGGGVASLNASVAAGIALFEVQRQRGTVARPAG